MDEPRIEPEPAPGASPLPLPAKLSLFARTRPWINVLLFVLTVASAFAVGVGWSANYRYAEALARHPELAGAVRPWSDPAILWLSLAYAAALIAILLGHEMGHYLTCRRYGIGATLPFFIPAPTLIGTMGAFIKITTPVTSKRQLFDIGLAGPLVSFCLSVPALAVGLALSKVVPAMPQEGTLYFGEPLLLKILTSVFFGSAGAGQDVVLHPVAFAGWVGLLVTAMNLFPLGQLDGGHVSYAVFGPRARTISRVFLAIFAVMGILFWMGWLVWALMILALGMRHPRTWDEGAPLGRRRTILAVAAAAMFVLSFIPDPVRGYNIAGLIRQIWP
jgi:Zn-dependent protease